METTISKTKSYFTITLLRGISVILVILYHFTSRYNTKTSIIDLNAQTTWNLNLWWGYAAVVTFFMMSGFLIGKSLCNQQVSSKSYLINRAVRLYPTFWCGIIITYTILVSFFPSAAISIKSMLVNFTMIPYFFGFPCVDGAYWTMQIEFFFSLIFGIILCFNRIKTRKALLFIWMLLSLLFFFLPDVMILKPIRFLLLPKYSHIFIAGIAAYFMLKKEYSIYFITLLSLSCINQLLYSEDLLFSIFFFISLLILLFTNKIDTHIPHKTIISIILSFFATISYSWYLIHQMIGYTIIKELQLNNYTSEWFIFIPIIITGGIAFCLYRFIEMPTAKIGKKISLRFVIKDNAK